MPSQIVNHVTLDTMVAPTMKMLLVKTKRREQAPALRYEIDFSAKVAETIMWSFSFFNEARLRCMKNEAAFGYEAWLRHMEK